jgi:hypothetical protein
MARNQANPQSKRKADARRRQAFEYRMAGMGYVQIAERLGVSVGSAFNDVKRELREIEEETRETMEEMIALELERPDAAQLAIWPDVMKGKLKAVDRAISIVDSRCRLLGLYDPDLFWMRQVDMSNLRPEQLDALSKGVPVVEVLFDRWLKRPSKLHQSTFK